MGQSAKKVDIDFDLRPLALSPKGIQEITALLQKFWPDVPELNLEYIDWTYNQNPAGKAVGYNAYDGDRLAGHYVTLCSAVQSLVTKNLVCSHLIPPLILITAAGVCLKFLQVKPFEVSSVMDMDLSSV